MTAAERQMADAIMRAVRMVRSASSRREIENAILAGDIQGALDAVRMEIGSRALYDAIPQAIRAAYERAATRSASRLRSHAEAASFDVLNPESVSWIRGNAAALIREFGDSSLRAIRSLIQRAYSGGTTPAQLARDIRESGIGLTERQATALANFRDGLEAAEKGYSRAQIEARVRAYGERLLRQRARLIARTELIRAEAEGNRAVWKDALRRGLLDERAEVEWRVASYEACEVCSELDGEMIGVGELFSIGEEGPPAHPACRCVLILHPLGKPEAA